MNSSVAKTSKPLSDKQQALLQLLSDAQWHSGQVLADTLGVSRTAVWKQLQALEAYGLTFESHRGKGYRLQHAIELLNQQAIDKALSADAQAFFKQVELFSVIDSTNVQALNARTLPYVCATEYQTQGRGRRGKTWLTPFAGQVTMSVACEFASGVNDISGLSLVVGLCVNRALEKQGFSGSQLKWPNDILLGRQKLGGILLEINGDFSGPCQVIIGIGLNVDCHFSTEPDQAWTDLTSSFPEQSIQRNALIAEMINDLANVLPDYEQTGFAYYQQAWQALDAFYDQSVNVHLQSSTVAGIAKGVDDQGRLIVETSTGLETFSGGEVSLRLV